MKKALFQIIIIYFFISLFKSPVNAILPNEGQKEKVYINPTINIIKSLDFQPRRRGLRERQKMQRFKADNGSSWSYEWNERGTIHRLYGGSLSENIKRNIQGTAECFEDQLVESAKNFIKLYPDFFKISVEDLKLKSLKMKAGIYYVDFDQYYQGINVYGGYARFRFDKKGELLLIAGNTFPNINLDENVGVSKDNARGRAYKDIGFDNMPSLEEEDTKLFIVPWPVKNGLGYILAWQVFVPNSLPNGASLYLIDALSGEEKILLRKSLIREAAGGRVTGMILPEYYNDPPQEVPFPHEDLYLLLDKDNPVYEEKFDATPDSAWESEGLWEFGEPVPQDVNSIYGHAGCPDPDAGYTGNNVYGYNLTGDYTNLMRQTYLTSPSIPCQINLNKADCLVFTFWRWLGVYRAYWETLGGSRTDYDHATVNISDDGGYTWTGIWANNTRQIEDGEYNSSNQTWGGWKLQFFDISEILGASGDPNIIIQWGMGNTDDSGTFCGWNIDDIGFYEALKDQTDPNGRYLFQDSNSESILVGKLKGKYAEVINEDGASALFHYESSDPNFSRDITWDPNKATLNGLDEFNAYYHINKMLAYIKDIEASEGDEYDYMDKKKPIKVIVRYGDNYYNAFWSPEHLIAFGEGDSHEDGFRNFVHFSDVIYHEYAHALTDSFYSSFMPSLTSLLKNISRESTPDDDDDTSTQPVFVTEFDAMHEAFSDYWAATINGDSMIGDGDFWVSHTYLRDVSNDFKKPDDYGDDAYANSLILSGAMWETREALGADIANKIFHNARYGAASEFDDFLIDVLMQDRILYDDPNDPNSAHVDQITEIFGNRGISQAPSTPTGLVAVAGDTIINLQWRENPDISAVSGYYVYFRTENDIVTSQSDPSVQRDAGVTTEYTLEGLTNQTTYVIYIRAYNQYLTKSSESDYVYATPFEPSGTDTSGTTQKTSLCFINLMFSETF